MQSHVQHMIDQATYELSLTNRLLLAKARYRELDEAVGKTQPGTAGRSVANHAAINAMAEVIRLEDEFDNVLGRRM